MRLLGEFASYSPRFEPADFIFVNVNFARDVYGVDVPRTPHAPACH
jgi:hypothetical protein